MTVDNDLVGVGFMDEPHQFAGEPVESLLERRPRAMHEVAGEIPVIERIAMYTMRPKVQRNATKIANHSIGATNMR